jgi:MYXO-CTERM domain-containing protein
MATMFWSTLFLASVSVPGDYPTISDALQDVAAGEVIEVEPGVWQAPGLVAQDVEIRGTAHGSSTIVIASGGDAFVVAQGVTLTLRNVTLDGNHQHRGVEILQDGALVLEDAWCRNGHGYNGGCIRADPGAELVVRRTVFMNNEATWGGHIALGMNATLEIEESRLVYGWAPYGGAISMELATAMVRESRFGNNSAVAGGAIVSQGGDLWVEDTWFHQNDANAGGGIHLEGAQLTMSGGGFVGNSADTGSGGGGLYLSDVSSVLEWVIFEGNTGAGSGGGVRVFSSVLHIENGWFRYNETTGGGGAVAMASGGELHSVGTMYAQNSSTIGGGAVLLSSPGNISRDFFCGNVTQGTGGALHSGGGGITNVSASVILFNEAWDGGGGLSSVTSGLDAHENTILANAASNGSNIRIGSSNGWVALNLIAWGVGGVAYSAGAEASADSWEDWYWGNEAGDTWGVTVQAPATGNPQLADFAPLHGCAYPQDVRPVGGELVSPSGYYVGAFSPGMVEPRWYEDLDGDGHIGLVDCNDADPAMHPETTWFRDLDGDGYGDDDFSHVSCVPPGFEWVLTGGDCNDLDPIVGPGAEWWPDEDADGYGDGGAEPVVACVAPTGHADNADDCHDGDPLVNPSATEVCNGIDDNCSGLVDDDDPALDLSSATEWWPDMDGDGYGDANAEAIVACVAPPGYVDNADDCDDSDPRIGVCVDDGGTDDGGTDDGGTDDGEDDDGGTDEGGDDDGRTDDGGTTGPAGGTGGPSGEDVLEEDETGSNGAEPTHDDVGGCGCTSTSAGPSRMAFALGGLIMLIGLRRRSSRVQAPSGRRVTMSSFAAGPRRRSLV